MLSVFFALSVFASPCPAEKAVSVDFPGLPGEMLQGTRPEAADSGTKLIILDFWASWCEPCRESLPASQALQKKYAAKGVRFLTVNTDDKSALAKKFAEQTKLTLPVLWDGGRKLADQLKITSIPTLIALNPKGQIVFRETGFTPEKRRAIEKKFAQCAGE